MPPAKPEPGRDPQMAERTRKLNLVFALTSLGMLLVFSLMIWADYDREWKRYQNEFNRLEVRLTESQIEQALGKVDAARRQTLEADLQRGAQEREANARQIREARAELERLQGEWYGVDQNFRFTKARMDVARYGYDEAVHKKHDAEAARKPLDELERQWNDWRLKLEDVIARRDAAAARLAELEKAERAAEELRKELYAERDRLQERLRKIQPGVVSFVRNLPVLDMANPSLKVNQIMPANLYDDVVFTPTPKVDRCTTCHLGIDKKGYEQAPQPYTTHPELELYLRGAHPMEKVGCTACHQGRGRATSFQNAAHVPSSKEQEQAWGKYTDSHEYHGLHYWDLPMLAKGHTTSQCAKCHRGVVEVPKAERLNTGLLLVERYGCHGCHKIKGWEGLRKAGPDLTRIASKTSEDWIVRWIQEPRAFRPTRMPQIWGVRTADKQTPDLNARDAAEINAVTAYVLAKSGRQVYPPPPRGDLAAGRELFEKVGCLACHRVGDDRRGLGPLGMASFRTHGPNLDGTGSKLDAGWLYAWVRNPKGYWHDTRMPNLRLSEKEAADVTAYLMSLKNEGFAARERPAADPAVRDKIVREYLLALNTVAESDRKLAAMSEEERTLFLGEKTIGRYGCFGCHTIAGFEKATPIGTELTEQGSKLVERLDFGFEEGRIPHTLPGWLHEKLMDPRVFDRDKDKKPEELLRMGKFHFEPEEADTIVTAILSLSKEQVPLAAQKQLSADERHVQEGARLVRDLNCRGCHKLGEQGGAIQEVIKDQLEKSGGEAFQAVALSPPQLYNEESKIGEGSRVHTPWLHQFLQDPSNKIRPWLEVRMPTFELSEEQTNTVTRYFAALDRVPYPYEPRPELQASAVAAGRDLFNRWQCVKCHVVAGRLPQGQDVANMAPDLANVPRRLRADWLTKWLADPQSILPGTRMPANFPANPEENAFPDVLGGDQQKQIEAVRAYLLTLGGGQAAAGSTGR
jgi:mono/diheme cytochrome c family protein/predicted  nucleic acid-binding Zn-ribbon protein